MTMKDEMKPKAVYEQGFEEKKPEPKKVNKYTKEIKELKSCLRDKDKRISKIEERLYVVKGWILTTIVSLLLGLPWMYYICFCDASDIYGLPLDTTIFIIVGFATLVIVSVLSWVIVFFIIWDDS